MTLSYRPGDLLAHRLDPRTKLGFQVAFAAAAFAHTTPRGLLALTVVALVVLRASGVAAREALVEYRFVFPFLLAGPVISSLTLGAPWIRWEAGVESLLASYRVVLVLLVSAAYLRTTPVRDSRAAIQRVVPGKAGRLLGTGVGFVFRFLPVLQADLRRIRDASAARLGDQRGLVERMRLVGVSGLARALSRADRFALALRARCFAWNPTLPPLSFSRADLPVVAASVALLAWAVA
ncbi:energy-coupling factor transporter transmembrane component T [Halorussus sp. MSC15.2]|uniref:energy-coupling factor transporter transmembrane component T family protein n=1 Tax=Halorussus sp. MSC15.2 TaxID=2283638 RepID=UPI0013D3C1E3|nr:energy-coupling factor transporter transmembrane component T [Halorussus sp. MSC15.2]NEU55219.1 energy-coupling factor transporter transmembrane protein EcfT [Halorussus sp. MSC15.2]